MRSEIEISTSEKAGFAQNGFLLSWEPLSPRQIADLLDLLEELDEGN